MSEWRIEPADYDGESYVDIVEDDGNPDYWRRVAAQVDTAKAEKIIEGQRAIAERDQLRFHAEIARSRAMLLGGGMDDDALKDEIMDHLGTVLGPLPGMAAHQQATGGGGEGS